MSNSEICSTGRLRRFHAGHRQIPLVTASILAVISLSVTRTRASADDEISFSRDVLPLLSDRCFHCHGPDETQREADLRLDLRESATADLGGYSVIEPGNPRTSELMLRVTSQDADLRMPPSDSHRKQLTKDEIDTLRRWIDQGAPWGRHWAFEQPRRPAVWNKDLHPIDAFVSKRLQQQGLSANLQAARHTLIRRLSFDLTGLPPSLEDVERFLSDDSPAAYESLVNRLLESESYGERMAMWWLDSARYSDTDGFQQDATRTNWPWRDWVIEAFNSNMPFDQFTIEQFAGDLLPEATQEQILATCFHRNHMTNGEGGRHPEESRIDYVIDRVNTMGTVWLGLTLGCCQCHSHKFDPITQQDYYSLSAFFNSIDEDGQAGNKAGPYLKFKPAWVEQTINDAQQTVERRKLVKADAKCQAEVKFDQWLGEQISSIQNGFDPWQVLQARQLESVEGTVLVQEPDATIQASGPNPRQDDYRVIATTDLSRVTGLRLEVFPHISHTGGKLSRSANGEFILTDIKLQVRRHGQSQVRDIEVSSAIADAERKVTGRNYGNVKDTLDDDPRNGWTTESHDPLVPHVAVFALKKPLLIENDEELIFVMLHRSTRGDANIGRFRVSVTDQPGQAVLSLDPMPLELLAKERPSSSETVPEDLRTLLLTQYLEDQLTYQKAKAELERAEGQLARVKKAGGELNVMVLSERHEPRECHVLNRGVWDQKGARVTQAVPEAILPWPTEKTRTRYDLAQWLVSRDNPLTARVLVNQLWQLCFGAGLVRTPDDFGVQGEFPSHPELLDWLAVEFMEHDWDVQHILRLIVTSETYRRSSAITSTQLEADPDNRWVARGARFRLPSWMIRDAALKTSGLLNTAVGGPPVMPYQPDGVWAENFMGRFRYEPSQGTLQFRRTIYAFWRRASAPTFLFDSAQRRVCEVRPRRTNTPLHALTLLNDRSLLEASRELARRAVQLEEAAPARLDLIFRSILSRSPTEAEFAIMLRELQRAEKHYHQNSQDAMQLLDFGQPERRVSGQWIDVAAYLVASSMIYNLDEAMTHE